MRLGGPERWATVVGVIRGFQHYRFPGRWVRRSTCRMPLPVEADVLVVRTTGDPAALAPAFRAVLK